GEDGGRASGVADRRAVGHARLAAGQEHPVVAGEASSGPVFIVNPASGNGQALAAMGKFRTALGAIEVVETSGPGDAEALAFRAASDGFGPVVVVGGDGTIQEAVNGLMRSPAPPPLGIVAAGSANDIARS